jgi:hypothetical protein
VTEAFADGFPGVKKADVRTKIKARNPGKFNASGNLATGWHKLLIPDGTIDLFEAYITLVLAPFGLKVHWVDSWFYHVRLGEVHCGTNVQRKPHSRSLRRWWTRKKPTPKTIEFDVGDHLKVRAPKRE